MLFKNYNIRFQEKNFNLNRDFNRLQARDLEIRDSIPGSDSNFSLGIWYCSFSVFEVFRIFVTLRDRVRCKDLRSTGMRNASNLAERLKWKWSGHVARMDNNRWTHKITMWDPRVGGRNVGRQRTRWADQPKRLAGDQWSGKAKECCGKNSKRI